MIETLRFGKTGLKVTKIAFGGIPVMRLSKQEGTALVREVIERGINFIDTANAYGDSEEKIGQAIQGIQRESLVIATKSMALDKETFLQHLHTSLKRLKTDYIDIFQMHSISSDEAMKKAMGTGGSLEGLEQAMKEGKVRHPAFSSHNLRVSKKMMRTGMFHAFQVPFNFIDNEAAKEIIPLARELDLGMIAMKPLGGGLLDDANLCIRYLMQFDGVVPDPGIERIEEMDEIIEIVQNPRPLREDEKTRMAEIRREMGETWCHRCDYCQPCPQGIPISLVLVAESISKRMPYNTAVSFLTTAIKKAEACTECRECIERCPYDLNIPELLEKSRSSWKNFLQTKKWAL
jgi:predicted aldo/keto reductase-like oxidoreductase